MAGERDQAYLPACLAYGGKALSIVVARQKSTSFPLIVIKKSVLEWPGGNLAKLRGVGREEGREEAIYHKNYEYLGNVKMRS